MTSVLLNKLISYAIQFSSVQSLTCVRLFATPWIIAPRPPCPSPTPCHPAISSSVIPFFSCPQSLPASGSFSMSQLFAWGGQRIGVAASASVLPMNTQDWSPLGWTGWISLQFKGLFKSLLQHHSSEASILQCSQSKLDFLHSPTLTSIHDHWKNHSLEQTDLCWQSNVSAF